MLLRELRKLSVPIRSGPSSAILPGKFKPSTEQNSALKCGIHVIYSKIAAE